MSNDVLKGNHMHRFASCEDNFCADVGEWRGWKKVQRQRGQRSRLKEADHLIVSTEVTPSHNSEDRIHSSLQWYDKSYSRKASGLLMKLKLS